MNTLLERILSARSEGRTVADSEDVGLIIEYIGAQASATVEVSAIGDITLKHGASGAEAVDATVGAPTLNGVLDVSDAAADTFGEVVDNINNSANWRAYLVDVLRSDNANDTLATKSATQAKVAGGVTVLKDTAVALNLSVALKLGKSTADTDAKKDDAKRPVFDKEVGKWAEALRCVSKNTFASGTSTIEIHRVNRVTGVSVKAYSRAGGATTVEQDIDLSDGNGRGAIASQPDEYLLVRMKGSVACTGFLSVAGKVI